MEDLVIRNGIVVTPQGVVRGGLSVRNNKIIQIAADNILPAGRLEVDCQGGYVLPGVIDPHIHIGKATEESFSSEIRSESISAVISGTTTLMGFVRFGSILGPRLTVYRKCKVIAGQNAFADFKFHAYFFTDKHLEEFPRILAEGITSAKLLLGYDEDQATKIGFKAIDLGFAYKAMEALGHYGPPVIIQVHCEEPHIISMLSKRFIAEDKIGFISWIDSRPAICEAMHAFSLGLISLKTGCPLYIVHVSAQETLDVIKNLRQMGVRVYAETCPQYLTLTRDTPLGVLAQMAPPPREQADIEQLWTALSDNTIDTIGSDHVVKNRKEREEPSVWQSTPGISGVGALLPLIMSEGVAKGKITIEQMVKLTSENAARIWGIYPRKGALKPGSDADIVILDPNKEWTMSAHTLKSSSDFSVYEGRVIKGKVVKTFIRGKLVAADGELVIKEPFGEFISPL